MFNRHPISSTLIGFRTSFSLSKPARKQAKTGMKIGVTFTGKETDCETGFSYFGARYYDPTLLTGWTAVDPMADKYPSLSPYNYCAWNPVKLVDPDGMIIDSASVTQEIKDRINPSSSLYNAKFHSLYNELESDSKAIYKFHQSSSPSSYEGSDELSEFGTLECNGKNSQGQDLIEINYVYNDQVEDRYLLEESLHALQYQRGQIGFILYKGRWQGIGLDLVDEANAQIFAIRNTSKPSLSRSLRDAILLLTFLTEGIDGAAVELKNDPGYKNLPQKSWTAYEAYSTLQPKDKNYPVIIRSK